MIDSSFIPIFVLIGICFTFVFFTKSLGNYRKKCFGCQEYCLDQIETICGHFYCSILYTDECFSGEVCKCGYFVTALFTESLNNTVAEFNVDHA